MDTKKTGALISGARKEKGITQKELAASLHVSERTVSKWERGAGFPDITMLEPLSDALGLPVHALLSGEAEPGGEAAQTDGAVRYAIKAVYGQCKRNLRNNIVKILAELVLAAFSAFLVFSILDHNDVFLQDISGEIPASIYENGVVVGETLVTVDGKLRPFGSKNFQGTFFIGAVEGTGAKDVKGRITWDRTQEGYQEITYYRPGIVYVDVGIRRELYISPDMQQFALELEDGRIIATNPCIARLQAVDGCRYVLSYDGELYPYSMYRYVPE